MSDSVVAVMALSLTAVFSSVCLIDAINARTRTRDTLLKMNDHLGMMTQTVDAMRDICDMWLSKYNDLVDDYNTLLSAYTRAYEILEENGLLPTDEQDDQEEEQ